jgi:Ca2+-binding EF-hand superfamily protein
MEKSAKASTKNHNFDSHIDSVIHDMINERKRDDRFVKIFQALDTNNKGHIEYEDLVRAYLEINPDVSLIQLRTMFEEADLDGNGTIELNEVSCNFLTVFLSDQPNRAHSLAQSNTLL